MIDPSLTRDAAVLVPVFLVFAVLGFHVGWWACRKCFHPIDVAMGEERERSRAHEERIKAYGEGYEACKSHQPFQEDSTGIPLSAIAAAIISAQSDLNSRH